jgi:hypothetical protein
MCLSNLTTSNPIVAEEDIVVYKLLYRDPELRYTTPYQNFPVKMGERYISKIDKLTVVGGEIIGKALYSFAEIKGCKNDSRDFHLISSSMVIARCIIPKGAEYYQGKFFEKTSFASNRLLYVEIIQEKIIQETILGKRDLHRWKKIKA